MKMYSTLKHYTPMFISIQALSIAGVLAVSVFREPQMSYFIHVPMILIVTAWLATLSWFVTGLLAVTSMWNDGNEKDHRGFYCLFNIILPGLFLTLWTYMGLGWLTLKPPSWHTARLVLLVVLAVVSVLGGSLAFCVRRHMRLPPDGPPPKNESGSHVGLANKEEGAVNGQEGIQTGADREHAV